MNIVQVKFNEYKRFLLEGIVSWPVSAGGTWKFAGYDPCGEVKEENVSRGIWLQERMFSKRQATGPII